MTGRLHWAGFDYVADKPVVLPCSEWRARIRAAKSQKRKVRSANGETFIHGPDLKIEAEIYVGDGAIELVPGSPPAVGAP